MRVASVLRSAEVLPLFL